MISDALYYAVEQLDHANLWSVIKDEASSANAQSEMNRLHKFSQSTTWRVVERPSGRLIICVGGKLA